MKTSIAAACFAATCSTFGIAASDHTGHHGGDGATPGKAIAETQMVEGLVRKVDKAGGKLTLAHGPLVNLGMPAMTMVFRVRNAAWLDQMKDGDRIRFVATQADGLFTVVRFEPVR